jgi:hypothetical protein
VVFRYMMGISEWFDVTLISHGSLRDSIATSIFAIEFFLLILDEC